MASDVVKLLLVSDTHWSHSKSIPQPLLDKVGWCDQILHAGDWTSAEVYQTLSSIKPVIGARGNCDFGFLKEVLPTLAVTDILGARIGVIHGWGAPDGIVRRIFPEVEGRLLDVVVYGHSHKPDVRGMGGILFVNPGSAGKPRFTNYPTCATMLVTPEGVEDPEMHELK